MERASNKLVFFVLMVSLIIKSNCQGKHLNSFAVNPKDGSSTRTKWAVTNKETCEEKKEFQDLAAKLQNEGRLEDTYVFVNDSNRSLDFAWTGLGDSGTILVLTKRHLRARSRLWRSENYGRTWKDISHVVDGPFSNQLGLHKNPNNPQKLYLVAPKVIFITEDGGKSWRRKGFVKHGTGEMMLEYHRLNMYDNYVAAIVSDGKRLYVTYDNFQTLVEPVKRGVHAAKWGPHGAKESSLYAMTGESNDRPTRIVTGYPVDIQSLERLDKRSGAWKTLLRGVAQFDVQGVYVFATKYKSYPPKSSQDERLMMISTDGGDTWKEAQLPTLTGKRFYSVLEVSEGKIFMHVDNPGDTGHGTLFTSSDGIVYSESLKKHLFPYYSTKVHDFYKVKSSPGVYLSSLINVTDNSIHTVITYNRGAQWNKVPRPIGVPCKKEKSEKCNLQIQNAYSVSRGIKAQLPYSTKRTHGQLLIVQAEVAQNLQMSPPDVYLSSDGGHNFRKILDGPHAYATLARGRLIVAVPKHEIYPDTIKFSTDEGHCWHEYRFTKDTLGFTNLLAQPGGESMIITIWGYRVDNRKWTVTTLDLSKVVPRKSAFLNQQYRTFLDKLIYRVRNAFVSSKVLEAWSTVSKVFSFINL